MNSIKVEDFADRLKNGENIRIVDVREELEFHTFNIGGMNIPLGKLPETLEDLDWNTEDEIVVICQHGIRSKTGCQILAMAGFLKVSNLAGGLLEWRKKIQA